jgi:hypothetical protein
VAGGAIADSGFFDAPDEITGGSKPNAVFGFRPI